MGINTKAIMKEYSIRPVKSLGQNFLIDPNIKNKIVESLEATKEDLIIEIGAGLGVLSKEIAKKAGMLVAVEIDKKLMPALTENLKNYKNVRLINQDILKTDIGKDLIGEALLENNGEEAFTPACIKVVGNLPYYITSPIIMKVLEGRLGIERAIFMVQKEVAHRIAADAGSKDYGSLSLAVQFYSRVRLLFNVSATSFYPRPKVDSSLIKLEIYKEAPYELANEGLLFKIIRASFEQRRKTLVNALVNSQILPLSKEQIQELLEGMDLNPDIRGEKLELGQFVQLSNEISRYI